MPIHLQPTAPLAERVLLPGDPARALLLAQTLLQAPRMFNHSRGLWGYTGTAADGAALSIQSSGMGGPSAAIVISELAQLGAGRIIRVGTCGALDAALALGDILVVTEAIVTDGTSRALGATGRVEPDAVLTEALRAASGTIPARIASTDLFYDGDEQALKEVGAQAIDMETTTLLTLSQRRGLRAASLLIVSDIVLPTRQRIATDALHDAERNAGRLAATALTIKRSSSG